MHLSMLCPTTPHPGYIGEKVGHLTCFDTKTCPIDYVGNLTTHHMHVLQLKALMVKFPIFYSVFEWGEASWDLTDWYAQ